MNRHVWLAALLALTGAGRAVTAEQPGPALANPLSDHWAIAVRVAAPGASPGCLERVAPVGGWFPYGGLLHWWHACWSPHGCGPDDYCRKPLPEFKCLPYCHYSVLELPEHAVTPARRAD